MPRRYHPRSMTRTSRNVSLLALAIALIGLLLVVGPNLHRIELAPGKPNISPPAGTQTVTPELDLPSGAGGVAVFLRILMIAAVACLAFILVGAIFKKELRIYLLSFVIVCLLIVGTYYVLKRSLERAEPDLHITESPTLSGMEGPPSTPIDEGSLEPPGWSFPAVAIAISVGVALLFWFSWVKLAPRWRRREKGHDRTELEELVETVASAADEIQLGGDPRSAVLRCYREMIRILCRERTIDHVHMTARELAAALHRVGFTARHVDQLTEIFELVRYGNRTGEPLAERAIGCLEAIRKAYAT
jgi:hypothetical protein